MTRDIFEVQRKLKFGVELSFEFVAHEGLVGGYPFASRLSESLLQRSLCETPSRP
jgi:hypothetical protein